jgi:uncharacterized protein YjgD (DUF1641 family)
LSSQNNVVSINSEAVLMNKLTEPGTISQLITLLDNLEKFNVLFAAIEQFISRSPEMADSVNRMVVALREELPRNNFISNMQKSIETLTRFQNLINSEEFKKIEETFLNERTLKFLSNLCDSASEAASQKDYKGSGSSGIFGLMKELTNPEIQPAIQFVLNFAKVLSKELKNA